MAIPGLSAFDLTGKVAVVTGGSSGIGRSLGEALAAAHAKVVFVARREDRLKEAVATTAGGYVVADVADRDAVEDIAAEVSSIFGPPDIIVNSAGSTVRAAAQDVSGEDWDRVMAVQLAAPLFFTRAFLPHMREQKWGRVINIGSLATGFALPNTVIYASAKAGIAGMTRAMAMDWAPFGVTANAICPGYFPTELSEAVWQDEARWAALAERTMLGRNGNLEDLHGAAIFLSSDASAYITGQCLYVDGGYTAK